MDKDLSIINHFNLTPHPEGGWFRRTYTCTDPVSLKRGDRNCASSILYFLKKGEKSCLHYLDSDEIWYFHFGSPVKLHLFSETDYSSVTLGHSWSNDEIVQYVVKKGIVFGAELIEHDSALLSCSVSPGYVDEDFHWPSLSLLSSKFPEQKEIIKHLAS